MKLPFTIKAPKERLVTNIAIIYFIFGLIFATAFAIYYRWPIGSFLSPGFYVVALTWPFQILGFLGDFSQYGWSGKPI